MAIFPLHRTYRHFRRYQQIVRVLARYGFGDLLETIRLEYYLRFRRKLSTESRKLPVEGISRPQRIRLAFEELGPTFIKFGQLLSTRPDVIPIEYAREFAHLLDDVPGFPGEEAILMVEKELGGPIEAYFRSFDPQPISAASIAQVHRAVTRDGQEVVVKIQRPNIRQVIEEDILILYDLAHLVEKYTADGMLYNPVGIVEEFSRTIRGELDFIREAHNIDRFRRNFSHDPTVYIPGVCWELTTSHLVTMEYIPGTPLTQFDYTSLPEEERKELAIRGARATLKEIFEHGFFHADPHPGNILILPGLVIAPVDFGMVGTLDDETKDALAVLLRGVVQKDIDDLMRAFYDLGYVDFDLDTRAFRRDVYEFIDRYHGLALHELRLPQILSELFEIVRRHRIRLPVELSMMGKALMQQNAIGQKLYPEFDILGEARPYVRRLIMKRMRPQQQFRDFLRLYEDSVSFLKVLPMELRSILQRLKRGDATVRMRHEGLDHFIQELDRSSNRLAFSLIIAALIIGSSIIMLIDKGPFLGGFSILGITGYVIAGLLGLWLVIAILRSGKL
ncbi:MAG: hypothetical protein D6681_13225 [Calditrichaeota bacterium]|nr:MAG: hypothetical protein D6681_13225 [Calditrichota bacterium]